ncbi:MAG TPA: TetR/AcrR family transcriptional regulator [Acidimicrobiia bacterium]|nr:TetR/AcrR family transcriptional regulator [Acidimicrobiia bacterium]
MNDPRRPGRPRSREIDAAVLDATGVLFAELGYAGVSVEQVAETAGVGKAAIYRRYPTKADLITAAVSCIIDQIGPAPDSGTLRGDLVELARGYVRMLTSSAAGRAIPAMLLARGRDPELARQHSRLVSERREESLVILRRAIDRGELAAAVDADFVLDMFVAPLFYRTLVVGSGVTDEYVDRLVDTIVRAFPPASAST